jgi:hypothetical protein
MFLLSLDPRDAAFCFVERDDVRRKESGRCGEMEHMKSRCGGRAG